VAAPVHPPAIMQLTSLSLLLAAAGVAAAPTIENGLIRAAITSTCQLQSIALLTQAGSYHQESGPPRLSASTIPFPAGDDWAVEVNGFRFVGSALVGSLSISQPSPAELLCTWDMPPMPGETFSVLYSVPAGQSFVQKALNVSCTHGGCTEPRRGDSDAPLAIGRVTPVLGLRAFAKGGTAHFSPDAGGVFVREGSSPSSAAAGTQGVMIVVQNKHTYPTTPDGGNLMWTKHDGETYTCTVSEYKGKVKDGNRTAAGCLAAAQQLSSAGVNYATYRPSSPDDCYVCSVQDAKAKLKPVGGYVTWVGASAARPNQTANNAVELSYAAGLPSKPMLTSSPFQADLVIIAPYTQTAGNVPWPKSSGGTNLQQSEYEAFWKTAQSFLLQKPGTTTTVKMHVPWTANFLEEVDTSRPENLEEAKRVISRCSELGVKHILWSARDSRVVRHEQASDGWSWGASLWLTMGEKLVSGEWLPSQDAAVLPPSLTSLLEFAGSHNVSLCPYVYPSLGMGRGLNGSEQWLFGSSHTSCDHIPCSKGVSSRLASKPYQDFLIRELLAFLKKTGSKGMGFDYTFINDNDASPYSQWAGWRRILSTVLAEGPPGLQVDNRQSNHEWGPWMWVATGSYAEPLQSDEQPESWHAFTPDMHTARLTANRMREMNFDYRMNKLCPPATAPGFFSHQSDMLNISGARAWDSNRFVRDFDYVGYKYALLSSVGSAGMNSVINTLPARDAEEYEKFPAEDIAFIREWLAWTDAQHELLLSQRPLPIAPGHGKVDGSYMFPGAFGNPCDRKNNPTCAGYIFQFNPNGRQQAPLPIELGSNLGIDCATSGTHATVTEIFPQKRILEAQVVCGSAWQPPPIFGKSALVVQVSFTRDLERSNRPVLVGVEGKASYEARSGTLVLTDVRGEKGSTQWVRVVGLGDSTSPVTSIRANGVPVPLPVESGALESEGTGFQLRFGEGPRFDPSQEVEGKWHSGSFSGSFAVPKWVFTQLSKRNQSYAIRWTDNDLSASWLSPGRLLLGLEAVAVSQPTPALPRVNANSALPPTTTIMARVDGHQVPTLKSWNCRGLHRSDCFNGFYFDLTSVTPEATHTFELSITNLKIGVQNLGLFFDNVESELTHEMVMS
jgi:hypothetical protein